MCTFACHKPVTTAFLAGWCYNVSSRGPMGFPGQSLWAHSFHWSWESPIVTSWTTPRHKRKCELTQRQYLSILIWQLNTERIRSIKWGFFFVSYGFLTPLEGRKALARIFLVCWFRYCRASLIASFRASRSNIRLNVFSKKPFCRAQRCAAMPACIWRLRWADSLKGPQYQT